VSAAGSWKIDEAGIRCRCVRSADLRVGSSFRCSPADCLLASFRKKSGAIRSPFQDASSVENFARLGSFRRLPLGGRRRRLVGSFGAFLYLDLQAVRFVRRIFAARSGGGWALSSRFRVSVFKPLGSFVAFQVSSHGRWLAEAAPAKWPKSSFRSADSAYYSCSGITLGQNWVRSAKTSSRA
jgi:hypothetical protein